MHKIIITSHQCRAARELIQWKQSNLSDASGVSRSTIADFERGTRKLRIESFENIIDAFEKEGIRFENNDERYGVFLLKFSKGAA